LAFCINRNIRTKYVSKKGVKMGDFQLTNLFCTVRREGTRYEKRATNTHSLSHTRLCCHSSPNRISLFLSSHLAMWLRLSVIWLPVRAVSQNEKHCCTVRCDFEQTLWNSLLLKCFFRLWRHLVYDLNMFVCREQCAFHPKSRDSLGTINKYFIKPHA
jgi:hypothetical protein